jgi:hypothetical protein
VTEVVCWAAPPPYKGVTRLIPTLVGEILEYARVRNETIVTAESCSAGTLALAFSKGEGASQHFLGGFVTYTKEMKARVLGVPPLLLQEKTAVCGEVASALAIRRVRCGFGYGSCRPNRGRGWESGRLDLLRRRAEGCRPQARQAAMSRRGA